MNGADASRRPRAGPQRTRSLLAGTVFTAATTDWAHGLQGNDAHVVRITKNVLERLGR